VSPWLILFATAIEKLRSRGLQRLFSSRHNVASHFCRDDKEPRNLKPDIALRFVSPKRSFATNSDNDQASTEANNFVAQVVAATKTQSKAAQQVRTVVAKNAFRRQKPRRDNKGEADRLASPEQLASDQTP
jgi:hypothetical protein